MQRENQLCPNSKGPFGLLLCKLLEAGGAVSGPTPSSVRHSELCDWRWQGEGATKPTNESGGEKDKKKKSLLWALTLAMPASSRLLNWTAGSEVSVEVKLSLADKQAALNSLTTRVSAFH